MKMIVLDILAVLNQMMGSMMVSVKDGTDSSYIINFLSAEKEFRKSDSRFIRVLGGLGPAFRARLFRIA